jgi:hypothetical protein
MFILSTVVPNLPSTFAISGKSLFQYNTGYFRGKRPGFCRIGIRDLDGIKKEAVMNHCLLF